MNNLINSELAIRLALTLMHSLWQGTAISLLAVAVASEFSRSAAALRYQIFFLALVLCALAAVVTFACLSTGRDVLRGAMAPSIPGRTVAAVEINQTISAASSAGVVSNPVVSVAPHSMYSPIGPATPGSPTVKSRFDWTRCATPVVQVYAAGVTLMLFRLGIAIRGDRRLRIAACPLADQRIHAALHRQAARLGLRFVPAVFQSARVLVPTVVGILRPAILLPVSVSTGLSLDAIEAILAHELGHIRRYDHLLQFVQRLIEAAFFFHPAVWYLSRRIHVERENACDDLAVRVFHKPGEYADALLRAAELFAFARRPAIASLAIANRSHGLRERVARLVEPVAESRFRLPGVCSAMVLLSLAVVLALGLHHRADAADPTAPTARPGNAPSGAVSPESYGETMHALPTYCGAVDKAVAPQNLEALASKTSDPQVLLGLVYLAPTGSPVRREISESAVNARPEYAPIVAVLTVAMEGADEHSVDELIKSDPDNALGYYLKANLLYQADYEKESLALFQKAATCPDLRLYGTLTANALFKTLDALNLRGRDRLAALSWTATRMSNFYTSDLQTVRTDLSEMSLKSDFTTRKEISDLLLVLGGHLFSTNFTNRRLAEWTIQDAFQLKATVAAAEKSRDTNAYCAVSQTIQRFSWPDTGKETDIPIEAEQYLPSRIWGAFARVDQSRRTATSPMGTKLNLSGSDKAAYEKAQDDYIKAGNALIEVSLTDADGIIGAYLKDLPQPDGSGPSPWITSYSDVEKLIANRPDVFEAATANERAMRAWDQAVSNDPVDRNVRRLMHVGFAIWSYASDHDQTLPSSLEVLYKDGRYLKDAGETKSLLTGKSYIIAAAGTKFPEKAARRDSFIVVYDDDVVDGRYQCALGNGGGTSLPANEFREWLGKQGK